MVVPPHVAPSFPYMGESPVTRYVPDGTENLNLPLLVTRIEYGTRPPPRVTVPGNRKNPDRGPPTDPRSPFTVPGGTLVVDAECDPPPDARVSSAVATSATITVVRRQVASRSSYGVLLITMTLDRVETLPSLGSIPGRRFKLGSIRSATVPPNPAVLGGWRPSCRSRAGCVQPVATQRKSHLLVAR
jgi:hypothetical protein